MTTAPKWHQGHIIGFDTETTGVNPHDDRIVTAAVVHHKPGDRPRIIQWIIDPEVDIPDEAAAVHGWTRQRLDETLAGRQAARIRDGRIAHLTRDAALFEIAGQLGLAMHTKTPVVAANAAFDLTLIEAELTRHGIDTLASRPAGVTGVVDPMIIDKQHDPYRKSCYKAAGCDPETKHHECGGCRGGKHRCGGCGSTDRTLTSLCAHYGVRLAADGAHDASTDALAALRLAVKLAGLWPEIARWKLGTLHQHQVTWRRQQCDSLRAFFDKTGIEHDGICPEWPVHTACTPVGVSS